MIFDIKLENALSCLKAADEKTVDEMAKLRQWKPGLRQGHSTFNVRVGYPGRYVHFQVTGRTYVEALGAARDEIIKRYHSNDPEITAISKNLNSILGSMDVEVDDVDFKPSKYSTRDAKSINNPATRQTVENYLNANPAGYEWNFLPLDGGDMPEYLMTAGSMSRLDDFREYIQLTYPDVDLNNAITFVKLGTTGDVLDADMLIHTAAHAVLDHPVNRGVKRMVTKILESFAAKIYDGRKHPNIDKIPVYDVTPLIIAQFLHMKAARNTILRYDESLSAHKREAYDKRAFVDFGEVIHEMLSIFIKRDKVKFSPNKYSVYNDEYTTNLAAKVGRKVNELFRHALDNVVGKVIVDE